MQSHKMSVLETVANLIVGLAVNITLNAAFVILAGLRGSDAVVFTGVMSIVFLTTSTLRAYIIRRIFNRFENDRP